MRDLEVPLAVFGAMLHARSASASSSGPSMSVSGVRNSWLTLREECGLGPVELRQRLGPPLLLLVGPRVGDGRTDRDRRSSRRNCGNRVDDAAGAQAGDKETSRSILSGDCNGQDQGGFRRFRPRASRQRTIPSRKIGNAHRRQQCRIPGEAAMSSTAPLSRSMSIRSGAERLPASSPVVATSRACWLGVKQIERGRMGCPRVSREGLGGDLQASSSDFAFRCTVRPRSRSVPQPPLTDHPAGASRARAERYPPTARVIVPDGTVGEGEVALPHGAGCG